MNFKCTPSSQIVPDIVWFSSSSIIRFQGIYELLFVPVVKSNITTRMGMDTILLLMPSSYLKLPVFVYTTARTEVVPMMINVCKFVHVVKCISRPRLKLIGKLLLF